MDRPRLSYLSSVTAIFKKILRWVRSALPQLPRLFLGCAYSRKLSAAEKMSNCASALP